jgi:hypothetical protein
MKIAWFVGLGVGSPATSKFSIDKLPRSLFVAGLPVNIFKVLVESPVKLYTLLTENTIYFYIIKKV